MSAILNSTDAFVPPTLESPSQKPAPLAPSHPDEFSPVSEEKWNQIKDHNYLCRIHREGQLKCYAGEYVLAYLEAIVGHGADLTAVRAEAAARLGVPESRLVSIYVPAF